MGKVFEKQIKTIEDQGEKQIDALKNLKPKVITYKSDDDNDKTSISKRNLQGNIRRKNRWDTANEQRN